MKPHRVTEPEQRPPVHGGHAAADPSGRTVFAAWALADVVSVIGSRLTTLALPWFVLTSTGSALQTGLVVAVELAPMVILKALAGPLLDRFGAARAGVRLDLASAAVAMAIPLLHLADRLTFPVLLVFVALLGACRGPADAAKYALVPAVARAGGQPVERVTGVAGTTERLATTLGLAGGGVLIAVVGAANALAVTALGFAACALLVGLVVGPRLTPASRDVGEDVGYVRQLAEGWAFLRTEPVLVAILVMVAVTNMLDQAWTAVLVPLWATAHGHGAGVVGLALATLTAGAVVGSLLATVLADRLPRLPVYTAGYVLAGLPRYAVLALDVDLAWVLTVLAVSGLASGVLNPIISALQFERTPDALVGRVSSLLTAGAWSLMPFGGLLGGALSTRTGLAPTFLVLGTAYLLVTLAPLALPAFRAMGRR